MKKDLLEIVDENDVVIGEDTRENVHKNGLLHREIHVWFVTPDGNIIFQHRAKDKDTYPDLLDATVGGHVEPGMTYEETAVKETEEETGVKLGVSDFRPLKLMQMRVIDKITGKINNTLRMQYAYVYKGDISDLHVEKGKAIGFEMRPIDDMFSMNDIEKAKFIDIYFFPEFLDLFKQLKTLI